MVEEKKDQAIAENEQGDVKETIETKPADEGKAVAEEKIEAKKEDKEKAAEAIEEKVETKKTIGFADLATLPGIRTDLPELKPGDVIRVSYRVIEGGKERTQDFEGTVIAIKNSGIAKTATVRKTSFGISVERIFPLNSRLVQAIKVKKHSKVRRAKLYYLRNLKGKAARLKELR